MYYIPVGMTSLCGRAPTQMDCNDPIVLLPYAIQLVSRSRQQIVLWSFDLLQKEQISPSCERFHPPY